MKDRNTASTAPVPTQSNQFFTNNAKCKTNSQCTGEYTYCYRGQCKCWPEFQFVPGHQLLALPSSSFLTNNTFDANFNESALTTDQLNQIDSTERINKTVAFENDDEDFFTSGYCIRKLCQLDSQCQTEDNPNLICNKTICECRYGYIMYKETKVSLWQLQTLNFKLLNLLFCLLTGVYQVCCATPKLRSYLPNYWGSVCFHLHVDTYLLVLLLLLLNCQKLPQSQVAVTVHSWPIHAQHVRFWAHRLWTVPFGNNTFAQYSFRWFQQHFTISGQSEHFPSTSAQRRPTYVQPSDGWWVSARLRRRHGVTGIAKRGEQQGDRVVTLGAAIFFLSLFCLFVLLFFLITCLLAPVIMTVRCALLWNISRLQKHTNTQSYPLWFTYTHFCMLIFCLFFSRLSCNLSY